MISFKKASRLLKNTAEDIQLFSCIFDSVALLHYLILFNLIFRATASWKTASTSAEGLSLSF